jgi:hypothetical protein
VRARTSALCPGCLGPLGHHPAPDRLSERGWTWAHCPGCHLSMDRDHAAARRIVSRGLLAQTHTATDRATGIRTTVDGTVTAVRRPKRATRRLRRARRQVTASPRPPGPKTTPGKMRPTPGRPSPARRPKTSRRMPDVRTVPATIPTRVVQRPAGHDTQTPTPFPGRGPGHGVPVPPRPQPPAWRVRLSRGTCRRAPAPPSGPASTTRTPPKSTPSARGSDPTKATAHGHAAPEKPETLRHTQSFRDAEGLVVPTHVGQGETRRVLPGDPDLPLPCAVRRLPGVLLREMELAVPVLFRCSRSAPGRRPPEPCGTSYAPLPPCAGRDRAGRVRRARPRRF